MALVVLNCVESLRKPLKWTGMEIAATGNHEDAAHIYKQYAHLAFTIDPCFYT